MPSIGIDIGGTRIKAGLVHENRIVARSILDVLDSGSLAAELPRIESAVWSLIDGKPGIDGIGIALPCIVDSDNNRILSDYVKYRDAARLDLEGWARRNWNTGLVVENDARAFLAGEVQSGACRGERNVVLLTIGTGIGSAVMIDGMLIKGNNYLAGNLGGHMCIDYMGKECNCGDTGCVETIGSSWAIRNRIRSAPAGSSILKDMAGEPGFEQVFAAASENDGMAMEIESSCLKAWSALLKNMIYAFDPAKIVLSGGVLGSAVRMIPRLQKEINRLSWLPEGAVELVLAQHPEWGGVIGAAWLSQKNIPDAGRQ
jgi:glucokinase